MLARALAILTTVAAVLSSACASSGAVARRPMGPSATAQLAPAPGLTGVDALVATALSLRGVPYRNGGADPNGFDCSGFTQYVFAQSGVALPRAVHEQFAIGVSVDGRNVVEGDLLFFSTTEPGASHVAIALGGGEFVHAPSSTGVVRVERLGSTYWAPRFLGARRVMQP